MTGIEICNLNFHKEFVTLDHSRLSGQQSCSGISLEDEWYPKSTVLKNQQVNLELCAISSNLTYITVEYLPRSPGMQARSPGMQQTHPIENFIRKFILK